MEGGGASLRGTWTRGPGRLGKWNLNGELKGGRKESGLCLWGQNGGKSCCGGGGKSATAGPARLRAEEGETSRIGGPGGFIT